MNSSINRTKLKKPPERVAMESLVAVGWDTSLAYLVERRFYELLDAGLWWGSTNVMSQDGGEQKALEALACSGGRCVMVGARVGVVGYFVALAHPADSRRWETRMVSEAIGFGKRPPAPSNDCLFLQLGRSDFPQVPQIFDGNEEAARLASLAHFERDQLREHALQSEGPVRAIKRL
jgi:hypothetical protein